MDSSLDPQIVNLAKAIRQTESGGNFQAAGKSGEYGAYQFEPSTWEETAPKYGVNVPLQQATPDQQNEVAYKQLAEWKTQHPDWNIGNFASAWNAGAGKPNAYLENHVGTNSQGVSYNTPQYAKDVATAYQQIKGQTQQASPLMTPPGTAVAHAAGIPGYAPPVAPQQDAPTASSEPSGGFMQGLQEDLQGTNPDSIGTQLANTAKGVGNFLFPAVGDIYHDIKGDNTKTGLQQAGDVGSSLLSASTLVPGLDAITAPLKGAEIAGEGANVASKAGLLANVGKNAALGGAFGVTGALGQGKTNLGDIAQSGLVGAGTGGAIGALTGAVGSKIADSAADGASSRLTAQKDRLKTLTKVFNENSSKTTNPIKTLEEGGLLKELKVNGSGKVDTTELTNPEYTGKLDNSIADLSDQASELVKGMKGGVPLEEFKAEAENAIKNDPGIRGSLDIPKSLSLLDSKLESARLSYGDVLPYTAIDEIRAGMNKGFNPDEMDTKRVIGNTARAFLYNGDGANTALKSAMANEAELIKAKNFVQKLHGTTVPGGQLGKYFADIIGLGVGGSIGKLLGPVGEGVGGVVGAAATHHAMGAIQGQYFDPIASKVARGLIKASKGAGGAVGKLSKVAALRGVSQ